MHISTGDNDTELEAEMTAAGLPPGMDRADPPSELTRSYKVNEQRADVTGDRRRRAFK